MASPDDFTKVMTKCLHTAGDDAKFAETEPGDQVPAIPEPVQNSKLLLFTYIIQPLFPALVPLQDAIVWMLLLA